MKGEREFKGTVVHLVPAMEQGGVERVVCNLNRAAVRAGWRSVVISRGGRLVRQIVADGGEHVALDLKSKNPLTYLTRSWTLRKVINNRIIEWSNNRMAGDARDARVASDARLIVCAHSRVPAWLYVGARKLDSIIRKFDCLKLRASTHSKIQTPSHSIIRLFDHSIISQLPWITYAHGANSVSRYSAVMTRGDRVVVPSKFLAGYLIENYAGAGESGAGEIAERSETAEGRAPAGKTLSSATPLRDRIRVIYPAVDFERFDPAKVDAAAVAALRREWGVRDGERVVMSIGRITALKGFDNVIRAFAGQTPESEVEKWKGGKVEKLGGDKLVIVGGVEKGKEPLLASLKQLAAELGVADRVVFAGARSDIPECLMVADEVVSGNVTKPESFGLSVAEALAMGKPVRLLRNFGGAGEILEEVEKWKGGKVERWKSGKVADEGRAQERREAIRGLCDFDIMWQQTEKVYEELLK